MKLSDVCRATLKLRSKHEKEIFDLNENYESDFKKLDKVLMEKCRGIIQSSSSLKLEMEKDREVTFKVGSYLVTVKNKANPGMILWSIEGIEFEKTQNLNTEIGDPEELNGLPSGLFREDKSEFACSQSDVDFTKQGD